MPDLTSADLERDLAADMRLVSAATPGPWDLLDSRVEPWHFTAPNGGRPPAGCVEWQILGGQPPGMGSDWGHSLLSGSASRHEIHPRREDLIFAAAAREGWPAAIRRALAAEARVAVLAGLDAAGVDHALARWDQTDPALQRLIVAHLAAECARLREMHAAACDRIAKQAELLARHAESP
jgi:hypothetical protein